jgi:6-pyruvoyltetrahydropterin/6-carboxytetrahydropterin synthase
MEVAKEFTFEASHVLPNHPGKCSNLHGHSWKLQVAVDGSIDKKTGMVMDYAELKEKVQPLIDDLDHAHLGAWVTSKVLICGVDDKSTKSVRWLTQDVQDNPTSENLLLAIGVELIKRNVNFSRLLLEETCTTACYIDRKEVMNFYNQRSKEFLNER